MGHIKSRRTLRSGSGPWPRAIAGMLAGGAAIAVTEVFAGLVSGAPSLVTAMGALVISLQPPGAKELAVTVFGLNDKLVLTVAVVIVTLAIAAVAGLLTTRRFAAGATVFVVLGLVAAFVAARQPLTSPPLAIVNAGLAVATGVTVLFVHLRLVPQDPVAGPSP